MTGYREELPSFGPQETRRTADPIWAGDREPKWPWKDLSRRDAPQDGVKCLLQAARSFAPHWTNWCSIREAERVARSILVVEPDDGRGATWRFGRVTRPDAPLVGEIGRLERRAGSFHLLSSHPDAITALLLVTRHDGPPVRLVYEPPQASSTTPSVSPTRRASPPQRRSTQGRAKGGGGETLAERAERLRGRRLPN